MPPVKVLKEVKVVIELVSAEGASKPFVKLTKESVSKPPEMVTGFGSMPFVMLMTESVSTLSETVKTVPDSPREAVMGVPETEMGLKEVTKVLSELRGLNEAVTGVKEAVMGVPETEMGLSELRGLNENATGVNEAVIKVLMGLALAVMGSKKVLTEAVRSVKVV